MLRARLRWQSKARKDSLMSHGRLALCSATKILLAFISLAAGGTDTTPRKSAIEEKMFWGSRYHGQNICTINVTFLTYSNETAWKVFLFKTVGRVFDRDIIFRDRTYLEFCFLGCVVKFQASEANSWQRSASSNPGNRVCVLFLFLSFFLFFFFSLLLLAFFLFYLYLYLYWVSKTGSASH